jgi:hypothetical protein
MNKTYKEYIITESRPAFLQAFKSVGVVKANAKKVTLVYITGALKYLKDLGFTTEDQQGLRDFRKLDPPVLPLDVPAVRTTHLGGGQVSNVRMQPTNINEFLGVQFPLTLKPCTFNNVMLNTRWGTFPFLFTP